MKQGKWFLGVPMVIALITQPAAHAATSGRIVASGRAGLSAAREAFVLNSCRTDVAGAVNGTDAAIIDISSFPAGARVNVDWTGVIAPNGQMVLSLYTAGCAPLPSITGGSSTAPGRMTVLVQQPTKWLVIDGSGLANVTLSVS